MNAPPVRPAIALPARVPQLAGERQGAAARAAVEALPANVRPRLHVPALDVRPAAAMASTVAWIESNVAQPRDTADDHRQLARRLLRDASRRALRRARRADQSRDPSVRRSAPLRRVARRICTPGKRSTSPKRTSRSSRRSPSSGSRGPSAICCWCRPVTRCSTFARPFAFYAGAFQSVEGGGDHAFQHFASGFRRSCASPASRRRCVRERLPADCVTGPTRVRAGRDHACGPVGCPLREQYQATLSPTIPAPTMSTCLLTQAGRCPSTTGPRRRRSASLRR